MFFRLLPLLVLLAPVMAGESLRLLAYNIKHGQGMDGKIDLERSARIIAREKPDLVALQEVDKHCKRSGSVDQAAELGRLLGMEHRFGKFMDFQGGEYGMAVLSKIPIEATHVHALPPGAEPRCALEVVVRPAGWPGTLSLVSVHHDWINEEVRVKQVSALLDRVDKRGHPVILAGDFNAEPGSASLELLKEQSWKMLRKGRADTCPSVEPEFEIDFFFARGLPDFSYEDKVIEEKEASDHRPIAVVISPNEEPGE